MEWVDPARKVMVSPGSYSELDSDLELWMKALRIFYDPTQLYPLSNPDTVMRHGIVGLLVVSPDSALTGSSGPALLNDCPVIQ